MKNFIIVVVSLLAFPMLLNAQSRADYLEILKQAFEHEASAPFFQHKKNGKATAIVFNNDFLKKQKITSGDIPASKQVLIWDIEDIFMHGMKTEDGIRFSITGNNQKISLTIFSKRSGHKVRFLFIKQDDNWSITLSGPS